MNERSMTWKLVGFELKHTPISKFFMTFLITIGFAYLGSMLLDEINPFEARQPVLLDFLFFMFLSIPISFIRYKPFTIQQVKGTFFVNMFYLLLKQTPIPPHIIRRSRFLVTAVYTIVLNSVFIGAFFFFSDVLKAELTLGEMIILLLSWVMISYIWGALTAATDPGYKFENYFTFMLWCIVYLVVFIALLTGFNLMFGAPFVLWSVQIVQTNPLLLVAFSAVITLVFIIFSLIEYKRYEKMVDYLL